MSVTEALIFFLKIIVVVGGVAGVNAGLMWLLDYGYNKTAAVFVVVLLAAGVTFIHWRLANDRADDKRRLEQDCRKDSQIKPHYEWHDIVRDTYYVGSNYSGRQVNGHPVDRLRVFISPSDYEDCIRGW